MDLFVFLGQAVLISLSGVMAPGPVTAVAIASGARKRYAGILMAVGHGIVEFPLIGVIVLGAGTLLKAEGTRIGIGLVGGVFLLHMGIQMVTSLKKATSSVAGLEQKPLWAGIILSGGNPYFLLWWATVGLALCTRAVTLGIWALALFALVHWTCDLVWLTVLSWTSFKGFQRGTGSRLQHVVLLICGGTLLIFGVYFIYDAFRLFIT